MSSPDQLRDAGAAACADDMSDRNPVKINLSVHAAEAIALRGIDLARVEATIVAPDWTEPDSRPGRTRFLQSHRGFRRARAASCSSSGR